jgi:hypothetical protein
MEGLCQRDRLLAATRLADDADIRLEFEPHPQPSSDGWLLVYKQNPDGFSLVYAIYSQLLVQPFFVNPLVLRSSGVRRFSKVKLSARPRIGQAGDCW